MMSSKMALPALVFLLCIFCCCDAFAGLGEPIPADSMSREQRKAAAEQILSRAGVKEMASEVGQKRLRVVLERMPDRELRLLTENADKALSGGTAGADALVQLFILALILGGTFFLLVVVGIVALFAEAAQRGRRGWHQAPRRSVPDRKRLR